MRLPHAELAEVDPAKVRGYLLSDAHPVGKAKARFFREAGFGESTIELLIDGLLQIARMQEVLGAFETVHGVKYVPMVSWIPPRADVSGCERSGSLIAGRSGRGL